MRGLIVRLVCLIALALTAAACRPSGPLHVSNVQVGRSLNSDNSVGNITTRFKRDDTMYVAVLTDAPGRGAISVRWLYNGRSVSEETKNVVYYSDAATEFHIQNSSGFPPGAYRVEIVLDGQQVATRDFEVEK